MDTKNDDLKEIYNKGELQFYPGFNESMMLLQLINPDAWENKSVLEIGCGEGHLAAMIGYAGASVLGIDYAEEQIARANEFYKLQNVTFRVSPVPYGKWDVIVMQGVLEHLDEPFSYLENLCRNHLLPGGKIIFSCPNWLNPRGWVYHTCRILYGAKMTLTDLHFFTPGDFVNFARKMNAKISVTSIDFELSQGKDMIKDLARRIPLADPELPLARVNDLMQWIGACLPHIKPDELSGANMGYKIEWQSGQVDDSQITGQKGKA